ncbi:hypothetical protein [Intestinibacter sp.]|uniref:hypothetical protein n=1 Tax=Intestinibacter sp. TaxID=1965304 RepID=UPI003F18C6BB
MGSGMTSNTYSFKTYSPIFITRSTDNSGEGSTISQLCDTYYMSPFETSIVANEINVNFYGSSLITYALGFNNRQTKAFVTTQAPSLLDINLANATTM